MNGANGTPASQRDGQGPCRHLGEAVAPIVHQPRGFGITERARRYLAPLIVGEAYLQFRDGLPDYVKLKNAPVPKQLTSELAV